MDQVVVFRVRDHELAAFEKGGSAPTLLGFGMGFFCSGLSFFGCLLSAPIMIPIDAHDQASQQVVPTRVVVLAILAFVCLVVGLMLLFLWWRQRGEMRALVAKIRARDQLPAGSNVGASTASPAPPPVV
jgi:uncharacterized membrane protein